VFAHACKLGLEGIVSKRKDSAYRSGRPPDWLKMKNSDAPAVKREAEQDGRGRGVNDLSAGALIILAKSSALCIGLEGET
jgi:ATP-dependent DNA ligase